MSPPAADTRRQSWVGVQSVYALLWQLCVTQDPNVTKGPLSIYDKEPFSILPMEWTALLWHRRL